MHLYCYKVVSVPVSRVAEKTTLFSYESGWQFRLWDLMTQSQQTGQWFMACTYGEGLLKILGITKDLPIRNMDHKPGTSADLASYEKYYKELMMLSLTHIKSTIDSVRAYYQDKNKESIPSYKPKK